MKLDAAVDARFQELDHRASTHIQELLSYANPLGRLVLATKRLEEGRVYALLPAETAGDPYHFNRSIVAWNPNPRLSTRGGYLQATASLDDVLNHWLDGVFLADSSLALIAESFLLRGSDGRPGDVGRVRVHNDSVYYVGVRGDSPDVMSACLGCIGTVPPGVGVLWPTGQLASEWAETGAPMSDMFLKSIASEATAMLVGAYDGESFLLWLPPTSGLGVDLAH